MTKLTLGSSIMHFIMLLGQWTFKTSADRHSFIQGNEKCIITTTTTTTTTTLFIKVVIFYY